MTLWNLGVPAGIYRNMTIQLLDFAEPSILS
jgi:hypothetical protein